MNQTVSTVANSRRRPDVRLWVGFAVLASIGLMSLVQSSFRSRSLPAAAQRQAPILDFGFKVDGGPLTRGGELPTLVGLGALIEPVANVDWRGGPESRMLVYLGGRELKPGEAVKADRPGRLLLRAEIEGETPQTAQIELQVSSGPEYRLDLEIHAEGGSADGGECFTAVVSSSSFNVHDAKLQGVTLVVRSADDMCILQLANPPQQGESRSNGADSSRRDQPLVLRFCRRAGDLPLPQLPRSYSVRASGTVGDSRFLGSFKSPYVEGIEVDGEKSTDGVDRFSR
jgi:hypothetical protein